MNHTFFLLQVPFDQLHKFLIVFLSRLKEDILHVLGSQLFEYLFEIFLLLPQIDMQRSLSLVPLSSAIDQST